MNLTSGKQVWKHYTEISSSSIPILKKDRLYFASPFRIYVLNAKTGDEIWNHSIPLSKDAEFLVRGVASPLVTDNLVYYRPSGHIVALDKNGKLKWQRRLAGFAERFTSSGSVPVIKGKHLYVADFESGLYCLNKNNGQTIWKNSYGSHATVLLSDSQLFYSTNDGQILALDQKSGKQLWVHKLEKSIGTPLSMYKDVLIYGEHTGSLVFLSKRTGEKLDSFSFGSGLSSKPIVNSVHSELFLCPTMVVFIS